MALKEKPSHPVGSWGSAYSGPCLSPVSFLLYYKAGTTQAHSTFPEETKLIPAFWPLQLLFSLPALLPQFLTWFTHPVLPVTAPVSPPKKDTP